MPACVPCRNLASITLHSAKMHKTWKHPYYYYNIFMCEEVIWIYFDNS